jgi:hypothetical protein
LSKRSRHFAFGVTIGNRLLESGPFLTFFRPVLGGGGGSYFFFSSFFFSPPSPPGLPAPLCWFPILVPSYLHGSAAREKQKKPRKRKKQEDKTASCHAFPMLPNIDQNCARQQAVMHFQQ